MKQSFVDWLLSFWFTDSLRKVNMQNNGNFEIRTCLWETWQSVHWMAGRGGIESERSIWEGFSKSKQKWTGEWEIWNCSFFANILYGRTLTENFYPHNSQYMKLAGHKIDDWRMPRVIWEHLTTVWKFLKSLKIFPLILSNRHRLILTLENKLFWNNTILKKLWTETLNQWVRMQNLPRIHNVWLLCVDGRELVFVGTFNEADFIEYLWFVRLYVNLSFLPLRWLHQFKNTIPEIVVEVQHWQLVR